MIKIDIYTSYLETSDMSNSSMPKIPKLGDKSDFEKCDKECADLYHEYMKLHDLYLEMDWENSYYIEPPRPNIDVKSYKNNIKVEIFTLKRRVDKLRQEYVVKRLPELMTNVLYNMYLFLNKQSDDSYIARKMVDCVKYKIRVRYHSTNNDVYEIFVPNEKIAFHYVNTIIGKSLIVISSDNPREPRASDISPVILDKEVVDKVKKIYQNKCEIDKLESDIKDRVEIGFYSETVMFTEDPTLETLKKEVVELTGHSKSKVNLMTLAELKEIMKEYDS